MHLPNVFKLRDDRQLLLRNNAKEVTVAWHKLTLAINDCTLSSD